MSKAFAEEILKISDQQKVIALLKERSSEVDDAFIQHFLDITKEHVERNSIGEADATLQRLYFCSTHAQKPRAKARALYAATLLDIYQKKHKAAMQRAQRCIDECAKTPEQCGDIEAEALLMLATLQEEYEGDPKKAIETLGLAHALLVSLGKSDDAVKVQQRIDELTRSVASGLNYGLLGEVLLQITDAHRRREGLQQQIAALSSELTEARTIIDGLADQRAKAATEMADLREQVGSLTATRDELQARQRLFATALSAPLWIAAVRADIQAGRISELTLPLLERLRSVMPEHAQPFIDQIRARNGLAPEQPINLDGLAGEERLFAAVANSLTLDPAADPAAFESLLDAWETYLSTPAGNGP